MFAIDSATAVLSVAGSCTTTNLISEIQASYIVTVSARDIISRGSFTVLQDFQITVTYVPKPPDAISAFTLYPNEDLDVGVGMDRAFAIHDIDQHGVLLRGSVLPPYSSSFQVIKAPLSQIVNSNPNYYNFMLAPAAPGVLSYESPVKNYYLLTVNMTDTFFWFTVNVTVVVQHVNHPPTVVSSTYTVVENDQGYPGNVFIGIGT